MQGGHFDVARNYIIYRDEHKAIRDDSPTNMKVLRRDGKTVVRFNPMKIASAMEKAFRASLGIVDQSPQEIIDAVNLLTAKVVNACTEYTKRDLELEVELIQDEVERQMMAEGYYQVAKDFIIYRANRAALREVEKESKEESQVVVTSTNANEIGRVFEAKAKNGKSFQVTERDIRSKMSHAARGIEKLVNLEEVVEESIKGFFQGITVDEIDLANILAARSKIEKEPAYSNLAAGLLLDVIYRESFGIEAQDKTIEKKHQEYFKKYIPKAVGLDRLSKELLDFDLDKLADALSLDRDLKFNYLGLQTLYDRYLIHDKEVRMETPQIFWMRVSMGLSIREGKQKNERAIEFYNVLSQCLYTSSTPTLFNSGTIHNQLSSCYLTTVMDDLKHIFKCISDDAQLSKWAGGLGNDWTNVRATGSWIKGTNGKSQGVIPFLKVANDTAVAVNQGGKRKGAMCAYLETWHLDIEDFLELRKNTGDERRRTHDMNTANWIPDLFMKRVLENGSWTMFDPSDVPDLHDLYGSAFDKRYAEYEKQTETGEIKLFKKVEALGLWRKMLSMLFETGHPWITFKDPSNIRSPQDHAGVVHSSNLCTEILLNTSEAETAVCNLGSINLAEHTTKTGINIELLSKTVRTALRMLDNVIDINFYPTDEARTSNLQHRPVGLGIMGFQDALYIRGISYSSMQAVEFADEMMEAISYYAILASTELAEERGRYGSYEGSKWSRGILPIDSIELLSKERGSEFTDVDTSRKMDWSVVREAVKKHGMRNSNTMAIAPTATISNITGVTQSIEPAYKHLFTKSNLSGEFMVHNTYLVDELKSLGMWDADMIDDLKYFDGSILEIERIPEEIKQVYLTAFEIEPDWIIECASRRQKWIDMGQSLNLYIAQPNGKKLHDMYVHAWRKGLKTTYYLRSLGATQIEKSTTDINRRGLQPRWMKNKSASSEIVVERTESVANEASPATKIGEKKTASGAVCGLDGECESCQ
jgi:ribonucleoside-diphosphate reductase alpha chain